MDSATRHRYIELLIHYIEIGDKENIARVESILGGFFQDFSHPNQPAPLNVDYSRALPEFQPSSFESNIANPTVSSPNTYLDMSRTTETGRGNRPSSRDSSAIDLKIPSQLLRMEEVPRRCRGFLLKFSADHPIAFDSEVNVVTAQEIEKYRERFDVPWSAELFVSSQRAIWNPPRGAIAIYGAMLTSGVTLPLQPFIARFLAESGISLAQLTPNSYWDHKGFTWGFPTSNKYWRNNGFFVQGEWGKSVVADPHQELARNAAPRHFYFPELWNKTSATHIEDQAKNMVRADQTTWEARDRRVLFAERELLDLDYSLLSPTAENVISTFFLYPKFPRT
ncbi:hypothetical protein Dsin_000579 [Dipteronia sinensis]|uniref:Uncharacterized protein n=1 Tax=Dipteronia sinensis TaxID=43782 RepID=A0AAE0EHJ7_9ROSI|nr:hypothetical protein Dsin_000579 [Dipteronia sinensis]